MISIYDIYEGVFDDDDVVIDRITRPAMIKDLFEFINKNITKKKQIIDKCEKLLRDNNLIPKGAVVCWGDTTQFSKGVCVFMSEEDKKWFSIDKSSAKWVSNHAPQLKFIIANSGSKMLRYDSVVLSKTMKLKYKDYFDRAVEFFNFKNSRYGGGEFKHGESYISIDVEDI